MKNFSELGIKSAERAFAGNHIKTHRILDKKIIVHDFKIGPSTAKPGTRCLTLQIEVDSEKRVTWCGSEPLITAITQVAKEDFPFMAIIKKMPEGHYEFTS